MAISNKGIQLEIRGLKEAQRETERVARELQGAPMLNAMRDCTLMVERDAKRLAPVDTGRLRASITPEVHSRWHTLEGVVGSNVVYAPYVELGTRPHWPPPGALAVWARRHGMVEFLVGRSIARRGTKARRFLRGALEKNRPAIVRRLERAVERIVR